MQHHSNNLEDRILWYDGSNSFTPEKINEYLLSGNSIDKKTFVTELTTDIVKYNKLNPDYKILIKTELDEFDKSWNIPESYKNLDIEEHIYSKLIDEYNENKFSKDDINIRISRIEEELELYKKYNIIDLLRTLIYIIDTFTTQNVVWGTGRGSSCSSYILYLIGLHDVDSIKYDLDINEFFREGK